jgi:chitinase
MPIAIRIHFFVTAVLLAWLTPGSAQSSGSRTPVPLLVGYFPQWGLYFTQPYYVKTLVTNGAAEQLDKINYAQPSVRNGQC